MRKIKANNVRIGDFIALHPPINGHIPLHVPSGVVETIIHVSPNMADVTFKNGIQVPMCIGGRGFDPDYVWIE